MDPLIMKSIEESVRAALISAGSLLAVACICAAGIGGFVGSWLRRSRQNFATRDDLEEVLLQLKGHTKAAEELKGAVADLAASPAEQVKSDESVWSGFRLEVLREMWGVHRAVVEAMGDVIQNLQQAEREGRMDRFYAALESYRLAVHRGIDLLTPQALESAQQFLDASCDIAESKRKINDGNDLKGIRRVFYEQMTTHFQLEEVLPWTVQKPRKQAKGERRA